MLKISLIDSTKQRQLIVEGKLIASRAAELTNVCQQASADRRGSELITEMKHIMKISPEGENVILELNAECLVQSWEQLSNRVFLTKQ
jgi:hypothetical protein